MGGIGAFKQWRQIQQMVITQNHQEKILTAIALYGIQVGHFPYPADPKAPLPLFGISRNPEGSPYDQIGIVPFRTLGLPQVVAKDGYGRYFTYIGGSKGQSICVSKPIFPLNLYQRTSIGSLEPVVSPSIDSHHSPDPIVIILISHGSNGFGAWYGEAGTLHQKISGIHGPDETENMKATQILWGCTR